MTNNENSTEMGKRSLEVLMLIYTQGLSRVATAKRLSKKYQKEISVSRVEQLEVKGLKALARMQEVAVLIYELYRESQKIEKQKTTSEKVD